MVMGAGVAVLLAVGALLAGLILGWVLAARAAGPVRSERDQARAEAEGWRLKLNEAVVNLAAEAEKNKRLVEAEAQLSAERESASALRAQVAAFQSGQEEREKAFEARVAELKEAKEALSAQFSEIGGKLLSEAQKAFLERADERFNQAGEKNEEKLKNLLQPEIGRASCRERV